MSNRLFNEEYASIIVFLCHISKNSKIIDSVVNNALELYRDEKTCRFEDDYFSQIDSNILKLIEPKILPSGAIEERTNNYLEERDKRNDDVCIDNFGKYYEETEDEDINKILKLNNAIKTMEVMGQILKNYPGTLKGPVKRNLVINTYNLGMRTLSVMNNIIQSEIDILIRKIEETLFKDFPEIKREAIISEAKNQITFLICMVSYSMIRKIAYCLSHDDLKTTIDKVLLKSDLSYKFVYLSISLNNLGRLPANNVLELYHDLNVVKNKFGISILKKMIEDHFYLFGRNNYKSYQKICHTLDITIPNTKSKKLLFKK